eukprot:scaffold33222_cov129-Isochrysis_galbana.AAC.2
MYFSLSLPPRTEALDSPHDMYPTPCPASTRPNRTWVERQTSNAQNRLNGQILYASSNLSSSKTKRLPRFTSGREELRD